MSKQSGIDSIPASMQELQDATDLIDELAARRIGINRTDLRCFSRLSARGPQTASELATSAGITGGAMTTVIDRLERGGIARRVRDPSDRRRVMVHLTAKAERLSEEIWGPIVTDARRVLATFSDVELEAVQKFLGVALENQRRHAARLSETPTTDSPAAFERDR